MTIENHPPQCYRCGGEMRSATTTFCHEQDGRIWLFENVPALVCDQCGEQSFPGVVFDRIQQIITEDATPPRTVEAGVYDLAAASYVGAAGGT